MKFIELRGGLIVREDALTLALNLESAGHTLTAKHGKLFISNGSTLTPAMKLAIKTVRLHLLAIAAYQPPEPR